MNPLCPSAPRQSHNQKDLNHEGYEGHEEKFSYLDPAGPG
jgi:hypothetical protein